MEGRKKSRRISNRGAGNIINLTFGEAVREKGGQC